MPFTAHEIIQMDRLLKRSVEANRKVKDPILYEYLVEEKFGRLLAEVKRLRRLKKRVKVRRRR